MSLPFIPVAKVPAEHIKAVLATLHQPRLVEGGEAEVWITPLPNRKVAGAVLWPVGTQAHLWVEVRDWARNTGVSDALIKAVLGHALTTGTTHLRLRGAVLRPVADWLAGYGFTEMNRCFEFHYHMTETRSRLESVWAAVGQRVPSGVETLSVREAHARGLMPQMIELEKTAMGAPSAIRLILADRALNAGLGSAGEIDADISRVLVLDGQVIGQLLLHWDHHDQEWALQSMSVAHGHRGGWANLRLKMDGLDTCIQDGRSLTGRFLARSDHADSISMARRLGMEERREMFLMERTG